MGLGPSCAVGAICRERKMVHEVLIFARCGLGKNTDADRFSRNDPGRTRLARLEAEAGPLTKNNFLLYKENGTVTSKTLISMA